MSKLHPGAQRAERDALVLPQHEHHGVLAVGEADAVEQRPVAAGHRPRRRVERETELLVEDEVRPGR